MTSATFEAPADLLTAIDGIRRSCDLRDLSDLTAELTSALNDAICSFMLRAELEDAFDTAFLRSFISETPTFSGTGLPSAR
jgi:hypothetical protein